MGAGSLSIARYDLAAAAAGTKVIFAGGLYVSSFCHMRIASDPFTYLSAVESALLMWILLTSMTHKRASGIQLPQVLAASVSLVLDSLQQLRGPSWSLLAVGACFYHLGLPLISRRTGRFPPISRDTVDIYDIITGQWNSTAMGAGSLSVGRASLAAAAAGTKVIFAGGTYVFLLSAAGSSHFRHSNGAELNIVDIYDVTTAVWRSTATDAGSLSIARQALAAAGAGLKAIFAGGTYVTLPQVVASHIYMLALVSFPP